MSEIQYFPPEKTSLDPEVNRMLAGLESYIAKYALENNVQKPTEEVAYEYEERRILKRREDSTYRRYDGTYGPARSRMIVGPDCEEVLPSLLEDEWTYAPNLLLDHLELREMLASTALAVLPYAKEFTTVVGDDRSGRVVALLVSKAINVRRKRFGLDKARRVFVSGRIGEDRVPLFRAENPDDAALIVTEYVKTGAASARLLRALRRAGFEHISIAAVDRDRNHALAHIDPERFFIGDCNSYTADAGDYLYSVPAKYTGITKENNGDPHSKAELLSPEDRAVLGATRRDLRHLAAEIERMYESSDFAECRQEW